MRSVDAGIVRTDDQRERQNYQDRFYVCLLSLPFSDNLRDTSTHLQVFVCDAVDAGIVRTDGRKEHRRSTRNRATPTPGDLVEVDVPDSPTEPDFVAATTESLTGTETTTEETVTATEDRGNLTEGPSDGDAEADATRAKVNELRKRFRECVERNERAPEAEQLSRSG